MSGLTQKYIEEKFQKKMSIELESEKTSEATSIPTLSDVEIQSNSSDEESFSAELQPATEFSVGSKMESTDEEPILDMEEASSRCRQHGL